MYKFLKKNLNIKCFFCTKEHKKTDSFSLDYNSLDGKHKIAVCPDCSLHLDDIIAMLGQQQ
jgi:hypothetical protein